MTAKVSKKWNVKSISKEKHERVMRILDELSDKMHEIDDIRVGIKREEARKISPAQTKAMLEEIKVPSLEVIKEQSSKKEK
ncbi:MAG: hypothetical protein J4224_04850 [Candidatus Diapherotrites archaeon]|uniref:Uncharacterized protein n=1 Tax=Candidatus Iainarchaeum sp. TaxID=3101447 RepID=A0A7J4IUX4_9ARCH|nr:MAG: hypothetical protein QT03_C0001G0684 [archaeon GW2011_AR10]MBS3059722.1 hypothetical protein [Candidatus Diapherotrites archaeon]HIH08025.1 hypothetical protein [Candidatus Diapherotrites archaeon]